MKRTGPLKRYTELNRGGYLPRVSERKRKLDRTQRPMLDEYRKLFPVCQFDGCGMPGEAVHEIAGGSHREKARQSRACILHLCEKHHRELQGAPYPEQLAHKFLSDTDGFNLGEFCDVLGRPHTAVTIKDVAFYLRVDT